jgi:hypothetical protein
MAVRVADGGQQMSLRRYAALYRTGAASSSFYILLKGALQLAPEEGATSTLGVKVGASRGICFGLESLNGNLRYPAVRLNSRAEHAMDAALLKSRGSVRTL